MDKDEFYQEQLDSQRGMLASAIEELVLKNTTLNQTLDLLNKRNQELEKIAYRTFHDMKEPMVNLSGLLELVKLETQNESVDNLLKQAHSMIMRLDNFGISLTDYTKVIQDDFKAECIDFDELSNELFHSFTSFNGYEKTNVDIDISEITEPVFYDLNRLYVLIKNLVSNSVQYRDVDKPNDYCSVTLKSKKGHLRVEVRDNGMGIERSLLPHIFDMFYRANNSGSGPGMGLYIVNSIVQESEGKIDITSDEGIGTTVCIDLPFHSKPPQQS